MKNNKIKTYEIKVAIIGGYSVGKTCLVKRFISNIFDQNQDETLGSAYLQKIIASKKCQIRLSFWDTTGNKRYNSILPIYLRQVASVILIYDITNIQTFKQIQTFTDIINKSCQNSRTLLLVGNKSDLQQRRQVSTKDGQIIADKLGADFIQTSAKDAVNVEKTFTLILNGAKRREIRDCSY